MNKKIRIFALLFVTLAFLCFCYMKTHLVTKPYTISSSAIADDQIAPSSTPTSVKSLYASGACLMDAHSGRILYGKKETVPLPMASTTKIMTCLLALEKGNPDASVTFSSKAASMPKVHLGAAKGKTFSLNNLLYSLMLESHNDTAVAIAEHIGGSIEGFADLMNTKAHELGMTNTHFVTPNGLDAPEHYSTPQDMCTLAAYAITKKNFLSIIQTPSLSIHDTSGKSTYSLTNHDAFLSSYDGALGIKTGFTSKAGYCFVGAASRDSRSFVSCVLGSGWPPNKSYKWSDTKTLMNFAFNNFTMKEIPLKDLSEVKVHVNDGKSDYIHVTQPAAPSYLVSPSDTIDIKYNIVPEKEAPVKKDTTLGTVSISINKTIVDCIPLYSDSDVKKKDLPDLLYYIFDLFLSF